MDAHGQRGPLRSRVLHASDTWSTYAWCFGNAQVVCVWRGGEHEKVSDAQGASDGDKVLELVVAGFPQVDCRVGLHDLAKVGFQVLHVHLCVCVTRVARCVAAAPSACRVGRQSSWGRWIWPGSARACASFSVDNGLRLRESWQWLRTRRVFAITTVNAVGCCWVVSCVRTGPRTSALSYEWRNGNEKSLLRLLVVPPPHPRRASASGAGWAVLLQLGLHVLAYQLYQQSAQQQDDTLLRT